MGMEESTRRQEEPIKVDEGIEVSTDIRRLRT